jgi:hypothetical protein
MIHKLAIPILLAILEASIKFTVPSYHNRFAVQLIIRKHSSGLERSRLVFSFAMLLIV